MFKRVSEVDVGADKKQQIKFAWPKDVKTLAYAIRNGCQLSTMVTFCPALKVTE